MEIVRQTIDRFRMDLLRVLGDELYEIVIHGSYALGDFTPFKGDLDYTVVTVHDLGDAAMAALFDLHDGYRREKQLLLHQLEGTTYPQGVLADPAIPCVGCYIGTGRAGWRTITAFTNSLIDLRIMAESGIRVLGRPLDMFRPSEAAIRAEQVRDLAGFQAGLEQPHGQSAGFMYAVIHWCARTIHLTRQDRIVSKSEACRWCLGEPDLAEFREALALARGQRYPYPTEAPPPWLHDACIRLLGVTGKGIHDGTRAPNGYACGAAGQGESDKVSR